MVVPSTGAFVGALVGDISITIAGSTDTLLRLLMPLAAAFDLEY